MSKKITLDYWQRGTFFGLPAIQGKDRYRNRWITRPYTAIQAGTVWVVSMGKASEAMTLGRPHASEPPWMSKEGWKQVQLNWRKP